MNAGNGLEVLGVALVLVAVACGEEFENGGEGGSIPAGPCNEHPWTCPAGQTCWLDASATAYACLNSGQGTDGDTCMNYGGSPTCTDMHGCFQLQGQPQGTCTPYCDNTDPQLACPGGRLCQQLTINGLVIWQCQP